jgi:hypothetical protein
MDRLKDTRVWDDALSRVLGRIEATANSVERGFPHYADITTGRWIVSDNGDWTGGFWNGMLWLAHHVTSEERYRHWARRWTELLRARASSETVFRGFLFYYGAALAGWGLSSMNMQASSHLVAPRRRRPASARARLISTACNRAPC